MKKVLLSFLIVLTFALTGCNQKPYTFHGTPFDPVIEAPDIVGMQKGENEFKLSALDAKVKVLFFGYTYCPDVCPLTLSNMRAVYDRLNESDQKQVAFVLISVDPERDTPDRLGSYVAAFNPTFYGVHVPLANLEGVKKDYGVYAEKRVVDATQSAAEYLIDHSAIVYVIDKDNKLREIFPTDAPPEQVAADVQHLLRQ